MFYPQPNHGLRFSELLSLVMVRKYRVSPLFWRAYNKS